MLRYIRASTLALEPKQPFLGALRLSKTPPMLLQGRLVSYIDKGRDA